MRRRVIRADAQREVAGGFVRAAIARSAGAAELCVDVLVLAALLVGRSKWQTAFVSRRTCDLPAADRIIQQPIVGIHKAAVLPERQLVQAAQHKDMVAVDVAGAILHAAVLREVRGAVVECARPGVVGQHLHAVREALIQRSLQRVVVRARSGSSVVDVLRAASDGLSVVQIAEAAEVRAARVAVVELVRRGGQRGHIRVEAFGFAGVDSVRDIADIGDGGGQVVADLLLQAQIVLVDLRQSQRIGAQLKARAVGKGDIARRRNSERRSLSGQGIERVGVFSGGIARVDVLVIDDRDVVRQDRAEDRPEKADVVVHLPKRAAENGIGRGLVSEAETPAQVFKIDVRARVGAVRPVARDPDETRVYVG